MLKSVSWECVEQHLQKEAGNLLKNDLRPIYRLGVVKEQKTVLKQLSGVFVFVQEFVHKSKCLALQ